MRQHYGMGGEMRQYFVVKGEKWQYPRIDEDTR